MADHGALGSSGISFLACEGLQSSELKTTSPVAETTWISLAPEPTSWTHPAVPVLATAMVNDVPAPEVTVLLAVVALTLTCPAGQVPDALGEADALSEVVPLGEALAETEGVAEAESVAVPLALLEAPLETSSSRSSASSSLGDSLSDSPKVGVGLGVGADALELLPNAADNTIHPSQRKTNRPTATTARRRQ